MVTPAQQQAYDELASYTLAHQDGTFIHQHIVDAFAAQTADGKTKPVTITFALVGLYLYVEKHLTGKQVQRVHMVLAKHRKRWLTFPIPKTKASVTINDVLKAPPGSERDRAIRVWCESVWDAWKPAQDEIRSLVKAEVGIV